MSAKETKGQREKRVQEILALLSEQKGSASDVRFPTVPFEFQSLARIPTEMVALVAALLRPHSPDAANAVISAFELLELAEGGKQTISRARKDGGTPGYDEGVFKAFYYRKVELETYSCSRATASAFNDSKDEAGNVDLHTALGKIFPRDTKKLRLQHFEAWVAQLFGFEPNELEPVFAKWRINSPDHQGILPILIRRAFVELPIYRDKKKRAAKTESGKKGAQSKKTPAATESTAPAIAEPPSGRGVAKATKAAPARKRTKQGTVRRPDRDKRLFKNQKRAAAASPSVYDEPWSDITDPSDR
jgi:hypothetical protein